MVERGHQVAVVTLLGRAQEEWETELAVRRLGMGRTPVSFAGCLLAARRHLRELSPDVIHSHSFHSNMFARMLKISLPHAAVVSTVHTARERAWWRMTAYRMTDWLASRTVVVSQAVAECYLRAGAVSPNRCVVLRNAIDLARSQPDEARRQAVRESMGAGPEFVWLAAGRMVAAKDYPNLLRALAQLRKETADVRLWIAGEGTELDAVQMVKKKLGLDGSVRLLGLRRDLPALMDGADGFVSASAWEGMPLALAEAMAMEKVVVATDVGGVRELAGDTGTLVAAGDPDALAAAMLNVMQRTVEVRQEMGRAARRRVTENFDVERRAGEWEALYQGLRHGARRGRASRQ
jgi:glycosyltransferase involved in cell wall biosynthesis